ncbi:hypothetical protein FI667_g1218, partial [Globisporangium splendens]
MSTRDAALCGRSATIPGPIRDDDEAGDAFLKKLFEEPHHSEFYVNIWSDEEHEKKKKRGRRTKRFTGPLIDIAQVAHVVTTMTDFRTEYMPIQMDKCNIWADEEGAAENPETENEEAFDYSYLSGRHSSITIAAPSVPNTVRVRSELPHRISEVSEEGSVDNATFTGVTTMPMMRLSDPLEGASDDGTVPSANDRDLNRRSSTPIVMLPNNDTRAKSMLVPSVDSAVPPPSNKNGSVVFSVVFMEEREWSWSAKFLLGIHEPIRHALFVMDRFLEQSYKQEQMTVLENHVMEFFTWFKTYFVEYLKCQHELKTSVLHPLINLKYSTKQEILKTYEEIYQFLAQIQQHERQLCSSTGVKDPSIWLVRLEALQKEIRKLNMTLHSVLNLEEKMLHPALSTAFTEKTFHQYVMPRVFRSIKSKRVVVPWILERSKVWGGEAEQQSIQGMLPFSAKFLYRKIWRPYFMSNVAGAMKNLNEFVDNPSALIPAGGRKADGGVCTIQ